MKKISTMFTFININNNVFQGLFRNFGSTFIEQFRGHLEKLVGETQKSSQRCAVEIITGEMFFHRLTCTLCSWYACK